MTLNMLHLPLDQRLLFTNAREHGLARDNGAVDAGYLVHALFARLFGDLAPAPFALQEVDERAPSLLSVLAYSPSAHHVLAERAQGDSFASTVAWERAGTRPMPGFAAGQALSFRVRLCPAIRVGKHHPVLRHGAEVDPYVAHKLRGEGGLSDQTPDRISVYLEWLRARFGEAASLSACRIAAMRDASLWRKGAPGEGVRVRARRDFGARQLLARRELVCEGQLVVQDEAAFASLLARGLGRHRAFGFGMLLLKPA